MNSTDIRTGDLLRRVRDYGASRTADFPAGSLGGELFAEVADIVAELAHQATLQTASSGGLRVGNASKAALRTSLRANLRSYNRTARAITGLSPALKKKFRLPESGDGRLLAAARAFVEDAEPLVAEFTKHELPADFLKKFKSDIDQFEAAMTERNKSSESRVKATASLEAMLARGTKAVQHLDVIVRNKYENDKPSLSAWGSARHLEQSKGRSKDGGKTDQPKTNPTKATPSGASPAG